MYFEAKNTVFLGKVGSTWEFQLDEPDNLL
jgi:hypothetical protein